jgi:hypothetical protein
VPFAAESVRDPGIGVIGMNRCTAAELDRSVAGRRRGYAAAGEGPAMNERRAGSRAPDPHLLHGQAATSAALAAPRPLLPSTRRHRAPEGAASRSFAKALTIALLLLLGAAWIVPHAVTLPLLLLYGMWLLFLPALAKPEADRHGPTDRRVLALGGLFGAVAIGAHWGPIEVFAGWPFAGYVGSVRGGMAKPAPWLADVLWRNYLVLFGVAALVLSRPRLRTPAFLATWLPRLCSGLAIVQFAGGLQLALAIDG